VDVDEVSAITIWWGPISSLIRPRFSGGGVVHGPPFVIGEVGVRGRYGRNAQGLSGNVQYVVRPSGDAAIPNALVIGLNAVVNL
jgi:hypothetical protein